LYAWTNSDCPEVTAETIFDKDCQTLSKYFENANNLISSLSNGYLLAKLADDTIPKTYEFCLKIVSSGYTITIQNLVFVIIADCSKALVKVENFVK